MLLIRLGMDILFQRRVLAPCHFSLLQALHPMILHQQQLQAFWDGPTCSECHDILSPNFGFKGRKTDTVIRELVDFSKLKSNCNVPSWLFRHRTERTRHTLGWWAFKDQLAASWRTDGHLNGALLLPRCKHGLALTFLQISLWVLLF